MAAADRDNQKEFDRYFAELKAIWIPQGQGKL